MVTIENSVDTCTASSSGCQQANRPRPWQLPRVHAEAEQEKAPYEDYLMREEAAAPAGGTPRKRTAGRRSPRLGTKR